MIAYGYIWWLYVLRCVAVPRLGVLAIHHGVTWWALNIEFSYMCIHAPLTLNKQTRWHVLIQNSEDLRIWSEYVDTEWSSHRMPFTNIKQQQHILIRNHGYTPEMLILRRENGMQWKSLIRRLMWGIECFHLSGAFLIYNLSCSFNI